MDERRHVAHAAVAFLFYCIIIFTMSENTPLLHYRLNTASNPELQHESQQSEVMVDRGNENKNVPKLGTVFGVVVPTLLSMFGVVVFLRIGK